MLSTIGSLELPPGIHAIFAKLYLSQTSSDNSKGGSQVTAKLTAEWDFDQSVALVGPAQAQTPAQEPFEAQPFLGRAQPIAVQLVHHFSKAGDVVVELDKKPDTMLHLTWHFLKITAMQVDSFEKKPIP
jgi:hypothetical protein